MNDIPDPRRLLLAYLLGEISVDERLAMDERMLADQDFSDQLSDAEFDLLDDYRAGRLSADDARRTRKAFAPERLAQFPSPNLTVGFTGTSEKATARRGTSPFSGRLLAVTAAAFVVAALGWFVALHSHSARNHSQQTVQMASTAKGSSNDSGPIEAASTATLLLAPSVTRGPGEASLTMLPETKLVLVEWPVPVGAQARTFSLSLGRGHEVLATVPQNGELRQEGGQEVAEFQLAPSAFGNQSDWRRLFLLIRSNNPAKDIEGEYSVSILNRK
jgi:hypothetical protein